MAYRIALLDDEQAQLEITRAMTEKQLALENIDCDVIPFSGAFDVPALSFDAYLLDISMPGVDGLTVARRIRSCGSSAPILFVTGIESQVFEAIRVQPLRFVRKGRMAEELPEAIHALCEELRRGEQTALSIQSDGMLLRVPVSRILYVESSDKVQRVVLAERQFEVRSTMAFFEEHLIPRGFFRIHRCYLVNLEAIYSISGSYAVLSDGSRIPISRAKITEIKNEFKRMMFRE